MPVFPIALRTSPEEWKAAENGLVATLLTLRDYTRGRGNEVHVVLILVDRDAPSAAAGAAARGPAAAAAAAEERALTDALTERVTSIRRRTGLDSPSVSVLFRTDVSGATLTSGPSPLVLALDAALRDKALAYYRGRTRRCKTILRLTAQPLQAGLRARLLFKLAHYSAVRGKQQFAASSFQRLQSCRDECGGRWDAP